MPVPFLRRWRAGRAPAAGLGPATEAVDGPPSGGVDGRASAVTSAAAQSAVGAVVRGSVRTADGWPLPDAAVTLLDATGRQVGRTTTGPAGTFATTAPGPGAVTVIVAAPGHCPQARAAEVPPRGDCALPTVVLSRPRGDLRPAAGRWEIDPQHSGSPTRPTAPGRSEARRARRRP